MLFVYISSVFPSCFFLSLAPSLRFFPYLLAVLQDALLGADAALRAREVRIPFATLHVDVHVELPAEHGHLGLSLQTHRVVSRHLVRQKERGNKKMKIDGTRLAKASLNHEYHLKQLSLSVYSSAFRIQSNTCIRLSMQYWNW